MFWSFKKNVYLCNRYPENNLFTLKKLVPIEDMERSSGRTAALFFIYKYRYFFCKFKRKL
jgi:hypothetical protein